MKQTSKNISLLNPLCFLKCYLLLCTILGIVIMAAYSDYIVVSIITMILTGVIVFMILWRHDASQKQKQLALNFEKQQKDLEERQSKLNAKFDLLRNAEQPSWNDILIILQATSFRRNSKAMSIIVAKANIIDLIAVSKIKNQLFWHSEDLSKALELIETIFKDCFDDSILEKIIAQFKEIEKYHGLNGYKTLAKSIYTHTHLSKHLNFDKNLLLSSLS